MGEKAIKSTEKTIANDEKKEETQKVLPTKKPVPEKIPEPKPTVSLLNMENMSTIEAATVDKLLKSVENVKKMLKDEADDGVEIENQEVFEEQKSEIDDVETEAESETETEPEPENPEPKPTQSSSSSSNNNNNAPKTT